MLNKIPQNIAFSSVTVRGGWYKSEKKVGEGRYAADGSLQERFKSVQMVEIIDLGNFVKKAAKEPDHYDVLLTNEKNGISAKTSGMFYIEITKKGKYIDGYKELGIEKAPRGVDHDYPVYVDSANEILKHYEQIKGL